MGNSEEVVTEAVVETLSGLFPDKVNIHIDSNPIEDLGLESVDGILFAPRLAKKLGIIIPDRENLLVDRDRKTRSVRQIVDVVLALSGR